MQTIGRLFVAFFLLVPSWSAAQDKDKNGKDAAKEAIKTFKKSLKDAKSEGDLVGAINTLAGSQHDLILKELKKWLIGQGAAIRKATLKEVLSGASKKEEVREGLLKAERSVRGAAAEGLAKYEKNKAAADALVDAARGQRDDELKAKYLECGAQTQVKAIDKKVCGFFSYRGTAVAKAAVEAAAKLKTKYVIVELIKVVIGLEGIQENAATPGMGPSVGPGGTYGSEENEQVKRKRELLPVARQALKDATGEKWGTGKEWQLWWKKNAATFKEQG